MYLKLMTANDTGMILWHTHTGMPAKAITLSSFSIMTKLKLNQDITAQIKEVKIPTKIVEIFLICLGRYR